MKIFTLNLLAALALTSSAHALLPPLYESVAEIKALMVDEQLGKKLGSGEIITDIHKNESGYEIVTNHHRLQVQIQYIPNQHPGPAQFKLHFEEPQSL